MSEEQNFREKTSGETLTDSQNLLERRVAICCLATNIRLECMNACEDQEAILIKKIEENLNWKLVGTFTDRRTGTPGDTKRREFQKLISQCKAGRIDQILVLSASRFGRNIAEIVRYTNSLKRVGVHVTFLKEGIDTADPDYNLITTMFCEFVRREAEEIAANHKGFNHGDDSRVVR